MPCTEPVQVAGGDLKKQARAVQVAAGDFHSLVLTSEGHVLSFGWGSGGRLGHGDGAMQAAPRRVAALADEGEGAFVLQVSGGGAHSLAVTASGALFAWGRRSFGRLGLGDEDALTSTGNAVPIVCTGDRAVPTRVGMPPGVLVKHASAGGSHSLAVSLDGALFSFGNGGSGQLGHGNAEDCTTPTRVLSLERTPVRLAVAGVSHSVIHTEAGAVLTCGSNDHGCVGHANKAAATLVPTPVPALQGLGVEEIAAGHFHTVVRLASGELRGFGRNEVGQLGANLAAGGHVVGSSEPLVATLPVPP